MTFRALSVHWKGEVQSLPLGSAQDDVPHEGLHIPRHLLEPMLLERAHEAGVSIMQPCVVKQLITANDRISGVATDQGEFLARFIVDAGGSRHWLARKLRIPVEFYSPSLHGYYNWARGECPVCYDRPLIYSQPQGWSWISRVESPDLYQCTRLTFEPLEEAARWMPDEFIDAGMVAIGPTRGADMTWRVVSRPAGRGFFMIGDAVRRNDPMTNRGFELAMADACKVALLLSRWKDGELPEEDMAQAYIDDVKGQYLQGLRLSYDFLRDHPHAPDWLQQGEMYHREEVLSPELVATCLN